MKKYILSLALCAIALCNFAQIQSYKIVSQADEERVILPYDSLTNITRNNLPSLIGQKIQILPEMGRSSIGLDNGPTIYSRKPNSCGYCNEAVISPDTGFTIYESKFGTFNNEVFDIIGADSIQSDDRGTYRTKHFYLIVSNEKYPGRNYLDVGFVNDEYNNDVLTKRDELINIHKFIILGYFEKLRETMKGKKYVNQYTSNRSLGGDYIVYNLSDGKPLQSIPQNHVWEIVDLTFIEADDKAMLGYILTSNDIKDVFCSTYLKNFIPYNEYLAESKKKANWEKSMITKYGKANGTLIIQGKVNIGFTKKMCEESWGKPSDINKTSGSWGVHEQWVYGYGSYLYFENGRLTSIQN